MSLDSALSLYEQIKAEWVKPKQDLRKCGVLLDQLKVALTKLSFLPTGDIGVSKKELIVARDVLEIAVAYSVITKDIPAFERYMAQLKCYYFDYNTEIGESEKKYQLLGLLLLFLLSQNRVSEFHTELELLPQEIIRKNEFIRHPLALEQYLMEGSYNKIFLAKDNVPSPNYAVFMDILLDTVRGEIAACLETSYDKISLKEAARRLNLKSEKEVADYGAKKNWTLGNDGCYHFANKDAKPKEPLPSLELAEQAIFYARELEMIV
ncbi:26S proteasome non-ATPase regulatory subunit 8 [Bradysia coprophila]|uniref:26S proteasome non-ATPase regulatory subunit 8 n=1 Tax=Bradysia coprophila TaxID=38358 RepID=UPI00187D8B68|nr:26S proteasome non-ATPase regulatory subunit 8 [Bradysia coprophila]